MSPLTVRSAALLALSLLAIGACSRNSAPPESAPAAGDTAMPTAARKVNDGRPRIADSPDGVHVEYRVRGQGAPLLVLVHGWSCDSNYWRAQLPALTPKYTVMTVDLAGHGASGRNRSDWSMQNFGADVAAAVRTHWKDDPQAPRQLVLVGHSMGGPVSVEAARLLGADVIGIIGVDTFWGFGEPPPDPKGRDAMLAKFRQDFIGTTRQWVAETFFTKDANPAFVRQIADDMSSAPPEVAIPSMISGGAWFDSPPDMHWIKVPMVTINADRRPMNDELSRKIAPTFRSIVIPNRGHFLMMEDPAGFNPILLREIDAIVAKARDAGTT